MESHNPFHGSSHHQAVIINLPETFPQVVFVFSVGYTFGMTPLQPVSAGIIFAIRYPLVNVNKELLTSIDNGPVESVFPIFPIHSMVDLSMVFCSRLPSRVFNHRNPPTGPRSLVATSKKP